jgi:hypothetical protein
MGIDIATATPLELVAIIFFILYAIGWALFVSAITISALRDWVRGDLTPDDADNVFIILLFSPLYIVVMPAVIHDILWLDTNLPPHS